MTDYLLSIDQGTTSSRAILFDTNGQCCKQAQEEFAQHYPNNGWVEHSPEDIWQSVFTTCQRVMCSLNEQVDQIKAIGITNQRETTLVWNRQTGEPIYPAIVWQDRRTSDTCHTLNQQEGIADLISHKTGLLLDPYFSATKLQWILNHVPNAIEQAQQGELAFGTVDTYLLWKLTDGKVHRTDATNASRTLLFNIHTQQWDDKLLSIFNIPKSLLPEVKDSADDFGVTDKKVFGQQIPILAMAGDQHAALVGQTCFHQGMCKSTYGTGCFMMVNTGDKALVSQNRLLTTVAYRLNGKVTYALEGSIFIAGAAIQWLRDGLHLIDHAGDTESLAQQTTLDHGVYLVPAFTGLGAPHWDPNARGGIFGLTRDTGIKEIVTAGLQSVCYQTKDLQKAMESDGQRPTTLRVDGGMVANHWMMQFLADILDANIERPHIIETTALGAAYLAGLQAGIFESLSTLEKMWLCEYRFEGAMDKPQRDQFYTGWQQAVRRVQSSD